MKAFRKLSIFLVLAICFSSAAFASATPSITESAAGTYSSHALWTEAYSSFEEMSTAADVVLLGTVTEQVPELRCDMVFTKSYISVDQIYAGEIVTDNGISVLQTGGSLNDYFTPAIDDAPIMDLGAQYILYLRYVSDETYGEYYLILGGYTGYVNCSELENSIPDLTSGTGISAFLDNDPEIETFQTSALYAARTNTTGGRFHTKTPYVFYRSTVTSNMLSYVKNGINAWNNGYSTHGAYIYTASSASSADVTVSAGAYGNTGWAGNTWRYNSSGNEAQVVDVYYSAYIGLNTSYQISSVAKWKQVAMHEMGHVFGLAHTDNISTIMRTLDTNVINSGLENPTASDYSAVRTAYGY